MERKLTDHIVENDSANHQLNIDVLDETGQGNANYLYFIYGFDPTTNKAADVHTDVDHGVSILFQNGPIKEVGVNGVTHEALLTIVIDRLRCFQSGPYSCRENAIALTHLEDALMWLQKRTRARIARNIEGTSTV